MNNLLHNATDQEWYTFIDTRDWNAMQLVWFAYVPKTESEWANLPTQILRRLAVLGMLLIEANLINPTTLYGGPQWNRYNATPTT